MSRLEAQQAERRPMGSLRFALVVILATVLLLAASAGVGFLILLALLKELATWM